MIKNLKKHKKTLKIDKISVFLLNYVFLILCISSIFNLIYFILLCFLLKFLKFQQL